MPIFKTKRDMNLLLNNYHKALHGISDNFFSIHDTAFFRVENFDERLTEPSHVPEICNVDRIEDAHYWFIKGRYLLPDVSFIARNDDTFFEREIKALFCGIYDFEYVSGLEFLISRPAKLNKSKNRIKVGKLKIPLWRQIDFFMSRTCEGLHSLNKNMRNLEDPIYKVISPRIEKELKINADAEKLKIFEKQIERWQELIKESVEDYNSNKEKGISIESEQFHYYEIKSYDKQFLEHFDDEKLVIKRSMVNTGEAQLWVWEHDDACFSVFPSFTMIDHMKTITRFRGIRKKNLCLRLFDFLPSAGTLLHFPALFSPKNDLLCKGRIQC